MRRLLSVAALLGIFLAPAPSVADPAYKAQDIIKTFKAPGLGKPRTIDFDEPVAEPSFDLIVTFDFNSDHLTDAAKENLDQFAIALRDSQLAERHFRIDGHTDATGTEQYNLTLSERRAKAVVSYLESKGIDASRLVAKGWGKSQPRVADPFDAANRRVETRLQQ
jgi:outer membrane protein OmpA-like peptidoglycan-associated protein